MTLVQPTHSNGPVSKRSNHPGGIVVTAMIAYLRLSVQRLIPFAFRIVAGISSLVLASNALALSTNDEAQVILGMTYLSTNYNDPNGLTLVNNVINQTSYSIPEWTDFFNRYFSTNRYTYALRFNWYWRTGHLNGWTTPDRALVQQSALYNTATNHIESAYHDHTADLGAYFDKIGDSGREDLVAWNLQLWDICRYPAPGFDVTRTFKTWYQTLLAQYPQWTAPDRYLDPNLQPYVGQFRTQFQLTLRFALENHGTDKNDIADLIGLSGPRRDVYMQHGELILDNRYLNPPEVVEFKKYLDAMPKHLERATVVRRFQSLIGYKYPALPLAYDGILLNIAPLHIGDRKEITWTTEANPKAADDSLAQFAAEHSFVWRTWLTANGHDQRRDTLIASAAPNAANFLLPSLIRQDANRYKNTPEYFLYDINRLCVDNTLDAFQSALLRWKKEGRYQPLAQFLWWLDIWTGPNAEAKGFAISENGVLTSYSIPITRDASGRIATFGLGGVTWKVGYFTSIRPNRLEQILSGNPSIVGATSTADGTSVTIRFDRAMDPASATNAANYSFNGIAPTSIDISFDLKSVLLTFASPAQNSPSISISGVSDVGGKAVAAVAALPVASSTLAYSEIGQPNSPTGTLVLRGTNDFEIRGGGRMLDDTADQFQFLHQPVSGDFDARVHLLGFSTTQRQSASGLMLREQLNDTSRAVTVRAKRNNQFWGIDDPALLESVVRKTVPWYSLPWRSGTVKATVNPDDVWVRMTRIGDVFANLYSTNGSDWFVAEISRLPGIASNAYLGPIFCAWNDGNGTPASVHLADYSIQPSKSLVSIRVEGSTTTLENSGRRLTFRVAANGVTTTPRIVRYTIGGTAQNGVDYAQISGQAIIPVGQYEATVDIVPLDDGLIEGPETVTLSLLAGDSMDVIGIPATATILDDEQPSGGLVRSILEGVSYSGVTNLVTDSRYPLHPDWKNVTTAFESSDTAAEQGSWLAGYLVPPETGDYQFFIASLGHAQLFLSNDESPSKKRLIAEEPYASARGDWSVRSDGSKASGPISLEAGKRYYIELSYLRGEYAGVAWQRPGSGEPSIGSDPIPGKYLEFSPTNAIEPLPPLIWLKAPIGDLQATNWYAVATGSRHWSDADALANRMADTHLASIQSQAEQNFLWELFPHTNMWIGLTDRGSDGNFRWTSGDSVSFVNWSGGQPDDYAGREDYVTLYAADGGRWNDLPDESYPGGLTWAIGGALLERSSAPSAGPGIATILEWPTNQIVALGSTARLSVLVDGGPVGIQWQFNGENIDDATNAVLEIAGITSDLAGSYRVVVQNEISQMESPLAKIDVLEPAAVTLQPTALQIPWKNYGILKVSAQGTPPLGYLWRLNGNVIDVASGPTLQITLTNLALLGAYDVVVTNAVSSVTSHVAQVTLMTNAVQFVTNTFSVPEIWGSLPIAITQSVGTGLVQLPLVITGTAASNIDYVISQGPTIPAGAVSGSMVLRLLDNARVDGNRTLTITLQTNGDPGMVLGTNSTVTVNITENDSTNGPGLGFDAPMVSVFPLPDGSVYLAGGPYGVSRYGGVPVPSVVRLRPDDTLDADFAPQNLRGAVSTVTAQMDKVLLTGGSFTIVHSGTNVTRKFQLQTDARGGFIEFAAQPHVMSDLAPTDDGGWWTTLDTSTWFPEIDLSYFLPFGRIQHLGTDGSVKSDVDTPTFVASGPFAIRRKGGILAPAVIANPIMRVIARLDSVGRLSEIVMPDQAWRGAGTLIVAMAEALDGKIYLGSSGKVSRLFPDGTADPTFQSPTNLGANFYPRKLVPLLDGGLCLLMSNSSLLFLNQDGSISTDPANPKPDGTVNDIAGLDTGDLFLVGNFTSINGSPAYRYARVHRALVPQPLSFGFTRSSFVVPESASHAQLSVFRSGPLGTNATVHYRIHAGTASPTSDFAETEGDIHFAPDDSPDQQIDIPLTASNSSPDGDRTILVDLTATTSGNLSVLSTNATVVITDDDQGFLAEYHALPSPLPGGYLFDSLDYTHPVSTRVEREINFDWSDLFPLAGTSDDFAVRWRATVVPPVSGTYTFFLSSDDGADLWVDGTEVARTQVGQTKGTVGLAEGIPVQVELDYYDSGGFAACRLEWSAPGLPRQVVPSSAARPTAFFENRLATNVIPKSISGVALPILRHAINDNGGRVQFTVTANGLMLTNGTANFGPGQSIASVSLPILGWSGSAPHWTLTLSNGVNGEISKRLRNTEIFLPNLALEGPTNRVAVVGDQLSLQSAAFGSGPFTFQWSHDGVPIPGATNSILSLDQLQLGDAGVYSVKAFTGQATTEGTYRVVIHSPPSLTASFASGDQVLIALDLNGNPAASLEQSPDFSTWKTLGTVRTNTVFSIVQTNQPSAFFRAKVVQ